METLLMMFEVLLPSHYQYECLLNYGWCGEDFYLTV